MISSQGGNQEAILLPWLRIVHSLAEINALNSFEKPQIVAHIEAL